MLIKRYQNAIQRFCRMSLSFVTSSQSFPRHLLTELQILFIKLQSVMNMGVSEMCVLQSMACQPSPIEIACNSNVGYKSHIFRAPFLAPLSHRPQPCLAAAPFGDLHQRFLPTQEGRSDLRPYRPWQQNGESLNYSKHRWSRATILFPTSWKIITLQINTRKIMRPLTSWHLFPCVQWVGRGASKIRKPRSAWIRQLIQSQKSDPKIGVHLGI